MRGATKGVAYDPATNKWTRLPDLPLQFGECFPESTVLDDGQFFAWYYGQAALLDPGRHLDRRLTIPCAPALSESDVVVMWFRSPGR